VQTVSLKVCVAENHSKWGTMRTAPTMEKRARNRFQ
jgi:hypothetical protein